MFWSEFVAALIEILSTEVGPLLLKIFDKWLNSLHPANTVIEGDDEAKVMEDLRSKLMPHLAKVKIASIRAKLTALVGG